MPNPTWAPTLTDVAGLVPDRVLNSSGEFDETSVPTADQVNALITQLVSDVQAEVGVVPAVPTGLADMATRATALGVAADIELNYTSSEADEKLGKAAQYYERYKDALARLRRAVQEVAESGSVGPANDIPLPVFGFPNPSDPDRAVDFTTWETRF